MSFVVITSCSMNLYSPVHLGSGTKSCRVDVRCDSWRSLQNLKEFYNISRFKSSSFCTLTLVFVSAKLLTVSHAETYFEH